MKQMKLSDVHMAPHRKDGHTANQAKLLELSLSQSAHNLATWNNGMYSTLTKCIL